MDLEGIILSEISQTEKDKYFMVSLICEIIREVEAKGNRERLVKGYKLSAIR